MSFHFSDTSFTFVKSFLFCYKVSIFTKENLENLEKGEGNDSLSINT